ncbi:MAG: response regulator transcription factor [Actinobacteria bacterium]|nr:response regulator transcription factor [Actinomycetota bacterium]
MVFSGTGPVKILIVDDHQVVRMGLRTLLEHQGGLKVVGEAGTAAEAIEMAQSLQPDLVLMDVRLPDQSGIEACRQIRSADPGIRVLMLTSYSSDEAIFAATMAGASGYLLKRLDAEQLYTSIIAIGQGQTLLDPTLSEAVVKRVKEISEGEPSRGVDALTEREREILKLIADGLTNKEIADRINLGEKTVRNHITTIFMKLGVSHRTQAAIHYLSRNPSDLE